MSKWTSAYVVCTGKSMSEALIFALTNPQSDERLFMKIENCKLRTSREHVVYINCSECQNKNKNYAHIMFSWCSELAIFVNNLLSYCGLVNAKIRASDIDLLVRTLGIEC